MEKEAEVLFQKLEDELTAKGYEVINPMKLNHDHDKTWENYMRVCIKALCDCDAIYVMKNHFDSRGAIIEVDLAIKLKLDLILEPMRVSFS